MQWHIVQCKQWQVSASFSALCSFIIIILIIINNIKYINKEPEQMKNKQTEK